MLMAFIIASLLVAALPLLYVIVKMNTTSSKIIKLSSFECGFESLTPMRQPFSVRFFILVVLFLVFDVESVLLFPCLCNNMLLMSYTLLVSLHLFFFVLFIGLLYEWYNTMLEWASLNKLLKLLGS